MTKIKMCGLRRKADIEYANIILPDFIGYVFAEKSRRYISPENATELTKMLDTDIIPVGVFVNAPIEKVIETAKSGTIKIAQLHGNENDNYISELHAKNITVIKAFKVKNTSDIENAEKSTADFVLLDSGEGSGELFDHSLISGIKRPYFLAGGLTPQNVGEAVKILNPYAVDASSCLETDGFKDFTKMQNFINAIKKGR